MRHSLICYKYLNKFPKKNRPDLLLQYTSICYKSAQKLLMIWRSCVFQWTNNVLPNDVFLCIIPKNNKKHHNIRFSYQYITYINLSITQDDCYIYLPIHVSWRFNYPTVFKYSDSINFTKRKSFIAHKTKFDWF